MQDYTQFAPMNFTPWAKLGQPTDEDIGTMDAPPPTDSAAATAAPAASASTAAGAYDDGGMDGAQAGAQTGPSPSVFGPGTPAAPASPGVNPNQSVFGRIHDHLQNVYTGSEAPLGTEYSGLTPQEIQALRPGILDAATAMEHGSSGQALWQARVTQAAQLKQQAGAQAQLRSVFANNPPPGANATPEQLDAWARSVTPGLLQAGPLGEAAVQRLQVLLKPQRPPEQGTYFKNDTTGEVRSMSKDTGTSIPAGWTELKTPGAGGAPHLWIDPKTNKYYDMNDVSPEKASQMGLRSDEDYRAQFNQEQQNDRFGVTNSRDVGQNFNTSPVISLLSKRAQDYNDFQNTMAEARNANPAAYKGLITQMAPLVDPNVQLRLGTLLYINKLDPSLMGEVKTAYSRMVNGSYPQDQLNNLSKLVDRLHNAEASYYDNMREDTLRGTPGAAIYIHPTDMLFGSAWRDAKPTTPARSQSDAAFFKGLGVTPVRQP